MKNRSFIDKLKPLITSLNPFQFAQFSTEKRNRLLKNISNALGIWAGELPAQSGNEESLSTSAHAAQHEVAAKLNSIMRNYRHKQSKC